MPLHSRVLEAVWNNSLFNGFAVDIPVPDTDIDLDLIQLRTY